jgi:predicted neutral ceramidase superfamily lipid hydrolase
MKQEDVLWTEKNYVVKGEIIDRIRCRIAEAEDDLERLNIGDARSNIENVSWQVHLMMEAVNEGEVEIIEE